MREISTDDFCPCLVGGNTFNAVIHNLSGTKNRGINFIGGESQEEFLSYYSLHREALLALGELQKLGVKPGDELVMLVEDNKTFLIVFWACLLGKIIPVPVSVKGQDEYQLKVIKVWNILTKPWLMINEKGWDKLQEFTARKGFEISRLAIESRLIPTEFALFGKSNGNVEEPTPDDIAYLQFSSGSTGDPKGVILTHRNLIANTKAIAERSRMTPADKILSWMPLTHDMGLICFHLTGVITAVNQLLMPTNLFVKKTKALD